MIGEFTESMACRREATLSRREGEETSAIHPTPTTPMRQLTRRRRLAIQQPRLLSDPARRQRRIFVIEANQVMLSAAWSMDQLRKTRLPTSRWRRFSTDRLSTVLRPIRPSPRRDLLFME